MRCVASLVAGCLAWLPLFVVAHATAATVTRSELAVDAGRAALTIEFSDKVRHRVFTLSGPERLVIDMEQTDRRSVADVFGAQSLVPGVKAIRVGTPFPGTTRVVLDLEDKAEQVVTRQPANRGDRDLVLVRWVMPNVAGPEAPAADPEAPAASASTASATLVHGATSAARAETAIAAAMPSAPAAVVRPAPPPRPRRQVVAEANAQTPDWLLLEVRVNGQPLRDIVRAEQSAEGLLLPVDAWKAARLSPLLQQTTMGDGTPAFVLDAMAGGSYRLDRQAQTLQIDAPATAFVGSSLGQQDPGLAPPPRPPPGVLLNYDLSLSGGAGGSFAGATLEAVVYGRYGTFVQSALASHANGKTEFQRLDSYWSQVWPERMETLVIGDTIGVSGGWSRPVRYAGIRWGRDFGLRPGYVTLPQVALSGEAALPSTVDVLVNNTRRASQRVQPGPFDMTNLPVVTGAGDVALVVRDLLGRETVVRQDYYASPRLLSPGLSDFSFEAGWLRTGFGRDSHYGDGFGAATWRQGLTGDLTGEVRAELQRDRRAAGVELARLLGSWGVGHLSLAVSSGDRQGFAENGHRLQWGIERHTPRGGASLQYSRASRGFAPFAEAQGPDNVAQRERERWLLGIGGGLWGSTSGAISFVSQTRWDGDRVRLLSVSLAVPLPHHINLSMSASKRLDGDGGWSAAITANIPLGDGIGSSSRVDRNTAGDLTGSVSAARNAPAGSGLGWRVQASTVDSQRAGLGLQYHGRHADWVLDAVGDADGDVSLRAGMRGTLGWFEGVAFASRPVGDSGMAVVRIDGIEGVPVQRSNQVVARTDARGLALVPGLLPWQKNRISIDPTDLPLDVEIAATSHDVTPFARSGVLVDFPVRRTRQALLTVLLPGGEPLPPGARVQLLPAGPEFITGRRGEVWLTDLAENRQMLRVAWPQGRCQLEIAVPQGKNGQPGTVGPVTCEATAP